jgi:3-deoxy-D-manno-octulosonic-acid transferase
LRPLIIKTPNKKGLSHLCATLSLVFYQLLCLILVIPSLIWFGYKHWKRSRKLPTWQALQQRMGSSEHLSAYTKVIWVHAVSLGEVHAIQGFMAQLLKQWPQHTVVITTTTQTGMSKVTDLYADNPRVVATYFPIDFICSVRWFIQNLKPEWVCFVEKELWPMMLHELGRQKIPVFLVNSRLKQADVWLYRSSLLRHLGSCIHGIAIQSKEDEARWRTVFSGNPMAIECEVVGNIKVDVPHPVDVVRLQQIQDSWKKKKIVTIACTHHGEEELLLKVLPKIFKQIPELGVILVPRHNERFDAVFDLIVSQGFSCQKWDDANKIKPSHSIILGNTMGELPLAYRLADVSVIAGSFIPDIGGHNPFEAVGHDTALIVGSETEKTPAYQSLKDCGGCHIIQEPSDLVTLVVQLFANTKERSQLCKQAQAFKDAHLGASKKTVAFIQRCLQQS